MKLFFAGIFFLTVFPFYSKGQMAVENKNGRYQVEREVFVRWNKFKPAWMYTLFFKKYKKGDKRNILQLAPTLASLELNSEETEDEKDDMTDIHDYMVAEQANIIAETHYYLRYEGIFNDLDDMFSALYNECQDNDVAQYDLDIFENEKEMLHEYLKAVREGHIYKGESADAMDQIEADYKLLLKAMIITSDIHKVKNRYLESKTP